ncbi:MAG: T9SS type A sorting domain-containing protein, partial [Sphingobacteriales bacterium]
LTVSADITGPTNPGAHIGNGSPVATYVITADNYSNITWTIPVGATNVSGQGTTSISFNYPVGYTTGTISVTVDGNSPCGSITRTLNLTCDAPSAPVVSGPVNVCTYVGTGIPVTFTIAPDATVSSYTWTLPPNVNVVSGLGTGSLTVTFAPAFLNQINKQIRVTAANGCGVSAMTIHYLEAWIPARLGLIAGPTDACGYVGTSTEAVYSVAAVNQAESYNWVVPAGMNIVSGQGTTTLHVTIDNSFVTSALTVNAVNNCGTGNIRSLTVTRTLPGTPGVIAGPTNPCMFMPSLASPTGTEATYSVPRVGDNTYNWTLPSGAQLASHTQTATHDVITVTFDATFSSGSVSVTATNNCGTSISPRTLALNKLTPGTPSAIDVVSTQVCPSREYTYTLSSMPTNATSVVWTVPTGGTIVSGQGTSGITVSYDGTAIAGDVTATGNNGCGNSTTRSVAVKLPACPPAPKAPEFITGTQPTKATTKEQPQAELNVETLEVTVFPNPSTHAFKLVARSSDKVSKLQVRLLDNLGREHRRYVMMPGETLTLGSELKAGAYFVEVLQGTEKVTKRILKY